MLRYYIMDITIVVIVIAVVIILVLTYIYWFTKFGRNVILERYIEAIAVLGTLTAIVSLYLSYRSSEQTNQKQLELDLVKADETGIIDTEKFFMDNYPYLVNLYKEIYSDNPNIQNINVKVEDKTKQTLAESHATQILITKIETGFHTIGETADWKNSEITKPWTNLWSTWFKSPTLRKYWEYYKQFEGESVRKLVDEIIIPMADSKAPPPKHFR